MPLPVIAGAAAKVATRVIGKDAVEKVVGGAVAHITGDKKNKKTKKTEESTEPSIDQTMKAAMAAAPGSVPGVVPRP